jgi:hypothetical protein
VFAFFSPNEENSMKRIQVGLIGAVQSMINPVAIR